LELQQGQANDALEHLHLALGYDGDTVSSVFSSRANWRLAARSRCSTRKFRRSRVKVQSREQSQHRERKADAGMPARRRRRETQASVESMEKRRKLSTLDAQLSTCSIPISARGPAHARPVVDHRWPGTGKTRTLTHRVAHLILNERIPPEQCLTYIQPSAANELEERLAVLLLSRFVEFP